MVNWDEVSSLVSAAGVIGGLITGVVKVIPTINQTKAVAEENKVSIADANRRLKTPDSTKLTVGEILAEQAPDAQHG